MAPAIKAGDTKITVESKAVKDHSKIFITSKGSTKGQSLYVSSKDEGKSFEVSIDDSLENDLKFDWWVVNLEE